MPSSTVPSTIASPEPESLSGAPRALFRCSPPDRSISQSPPKKTPQPANMPSSTAPCPEALSTASSTRSKATALISNARPEAHDEADGAEADAEPERRGRADHERGGGKRAPAEGLGHRVRSWPTHRPERARRRRVL